MYPTQVQPNLLKNNSQKFKKYFFARLCNFIPSVKNGSHKKRHIRLFIFHSSKLKKVFSLELERKKVMKQSESKDDRKKERGFPRK